MAIDFSRFNFFKRLDARGRIFVLLIGVVGIIFLVYLGTRLLSQGAATTGPTRVAGAPAGLRSIPGGQLTPEYQRAVMQANIQAAEKARMSGGSAIPITLNIPQTPGAAGCVICPEEAANVKNDLDNWVKQGTVSPDVAQGLEQLANQNVPVSEFANALDGLVKQGKLTPDQARKLLDEYKKQHGNNAIKASGQAMDNLIKSGKLPLEAANDLLNLQKKDVTPAQYAAALQRLENAGKISPETAQQLLTQYTQQRAKEIVSKSVASLHNLARDGQLTPDVEKDLVNLENQMVGVDVYTDALQKYITAGKLVPMVANKILDEYKAQKEEIGAGGTVAQMIKAAENAAYNEIAALLKDKKITPDVASLLVHMIEKNVPMEDFQNTVNQLVNEKKLSPEIARLKIGDYKVISGLRDEANRLAALQGNNASPADYADELKRAVQAGVLTPDQAAQLMKDYQAMAAKAPPPITTAAPETAAFAELQKRAAEAAPAAAPARTPTAEFTAAQAQAEQAAAQARQANIEALIGAMEGQAQQLVAAWQPPVQEYISGNPQIKKTTTTRTHGAHGEEEITESKTKTTTITHEAGTPIIKAGTILFAVLDNEVNSDYPDTPVLATIVLGKYKGAKLLGKMVLTSTPTGQMDRVILNFSLMNLEEWPKSQSITAYAIDPDTAREAIASDVNHHYIMRFGAMMATSFMQGYANAITTSSSTTTTGIFGTSTTHPELSPGNKLAVGFGQVGQTMGSVLQNYTNIPPTVRVASGVSLGILFMQDVTVQDVTV